MVDGAETVTEEARAAGAAGEVTVMERLEMTMHLGTDRQLAVLQQRGQLAVLRQ